MKQYKSSMGYLVFIKLSEFSFFFSLNFHPAPLAQTQRPPAEDFFLATVLLQWFSTFFSDVSFGQ